MNKGSDRIAQLRELVHQLPKANIGQLQLQTLRTIEATPAGLSRLWFPYTQPSAVLFVFVFFEFLSPRRLGCFISFSVGGFSPSIRE